MTDHPVSPGLSVAGQHGAATTEGRYGKDFLLAKIAEKRGPPYRPAAADPEPELDEGDDYYEAPEEVADAPEPTIPPMADILGPGGAVSQHLPGYEHRAQQIEAAECIRQAILAKEHAIVEAGTGVGKSLAYLVPAIYARKRTIVATSGKMLQDQLALQDLPFLQEALPVSFTYAVLKGRGNYLCAVKYDEEAGAQLLLGGSEEFAVLQAWLENTTVGDLEEMTAPLPGELRANVTADSDECLGKDCARYRDCYYYRARAKAEAAQIVVANHTLLALDCVIRAQTDDNASILPDRELIVVDEAHNLEDTFTRAFEAEVSSAGVHGLLRSKRIKECQVDTALTAGALDAAEVLFAYLGASEKTTRLTYPLPTRLQDLIETLMLRLRSVAFAVGKGNPHPVGTPKAKIVDAVKERLEKLVETLDGALVENAADVVYVERRLSHRQRPVVALKRCPITIGPLLADALFERWPVVSTSATLSANNGFEYFKSRVGLEEARELRVGSPFDYPSHAMVYLPPAGALFDPARYYKDGSVEYFDRLAKEIEQLILASQGRAFCLFTSNKALDEAHRRLASRLQWQVLRQGELPRAEMIRQFKADGRAVIFATRSLFEGVDIVGDALSLVIIDKMPFQAPDDPVYSARCDALNKERDSEWAWWNELALPMATIVTKQAFGRLIRTKTDTGVVALLDGRLTTKRYGTGVIRALPPATPTRSLDAVRAFFQTRQMTEPQQRQLI